MEDKPVVEVDHDLKFPHIFVLNASAGSGKTHSLSLRFVQFLLSNRIKNHLSQNTLNNMLAITFTNKAANEMKERILRQLKLIAISDVQDDNQAVKREQVLRQLKPIDIDDKDLQKSSDKLVEEIIKHYTDFQVRTIDSFLRSIIAASLRETNLQPNFDIAMDAIPYIEYALDDLLSTIQTQQDTKELFLRFLDIYLNVEGKTGFNPRKNIIELVKRFRYLESKKGKRIESNKVTSDEITQKRNTLKIAVHKLYDGIASANIQTKFLPPKDELIGKINNNDFSNQMWQKDDVAYILKKQDNNFRDSLQHTWEDIRVLLFDLLITTDGSRYSAYREILMNIENALEDITKTRGKILIDDINKYVRKLIDEYNVPEVYFNLGESIFHYFIDEFQDTDRAQWNNIRALVIEALSNGGSLFYVGDKKQSIYRFKGSDSSLFDEVIEDKEITPIIKELYIRKLSSNYRSTSLLVDFFNETFDPDYLKSMIVDNEKDPVTSTINAQVKRLVENIYRDSAQSTPHNDKSQDDSGYLFIEHINSKDNQSNTGTATSLDDGNPDMNDVEQSAYEYVLIKRINDVIVNLHGKGISYSDIAILVRENAQIESLSGELKQNGIPVQSTQGFDIRKHTLIREVISFLSFLNNPLDGLSFIGFISGEIFNRVSTMKTNEIYDWLLHQRGEAYLYIAFKEWQPKLWDEFIKPLFNAVGYLPAYDIVHEFIGRFKIHENFGSSIGFFMHLLGMLKEQEDKGENNLDSLLDHWKTQEKDDVGFFVNMTSVDAVKLLTIHKSKGLQFPVVIIPYASLNLRKNGNDKQNMLIIEGPDKLNLSYTNKLHRSIIQSIKADDASINAYIKEQALSFMDELNAFYVAVTRAQKELYIFIQDKKDPLYNLFEHKLDANSRYEQGAHTVLKKQEKEGDDVFRKKSQASTHWQNHIYVKQPDIAALENYNEEKRGDIIHDILSRITSVDTDTRERLIELLGTIQEQTIQNQPALVDNILLSLALEETKPWFTSGSSTGILTEKEVVDRHGDLKRIDRLIVNQTEAIIVDYKTGGLKDIDKHKKQVKEYMDIISDLYPTKKIKLYLLFFVHNSVEVVR
jgi:ATP-dependent exoDNAse (exonuclease V) beta subunit